MEVKTKYIFLIIYHSITNGYLILSNAFSAFIVMVILVGVIFSVCDSFSMQFYDLLFFERLHFFLVKCLVFFGV